MANLAGAGSEDSGQQLARPSPSRCPSIEYFLGGLNMFSDEGTAQRKHIDKENVQACVKCVSRKSLDMRNWPVPAPSMCP